MPFSILLLPVSFFFVLNHYYYPDAPDGTPPFYGIDIVS